ncbi:MAG TPA: ABC transporter ATP-binding protein [Trueperaceae bacterium]|nr:ABC transporter ATP-binding protein [Trueperaceae bacterium]
MTAPHGEGLRPPLLSVTGLRAGYGQAEVLFGVDLEVGAGEIVAVLGSNGAGKTTLLRCIAGLLTGGSGSVHFGGADVTRSGIERRVGAGIALVPEGRMLFSGLTVEENLRLGGFRAEPSSRAAMLETVYETFPDLARRRRQLAGTLSGGQQQMVAIGRGLMASPRLLLIDEFSLGLAPAIVEAILEAIATLHARTGLSVLMVEQDIRVGLHLAARGYVLEHGAVAMVDEARKLLADPRVREAYLGL